MSTKVVSFRVNEKEEMIIRSKADKAEQSIGEYSKLCALEEEIEVKTDKKKIAALYVNLIDSINAIDNGSVKKSVRESLEALLCQF